MCHTDQAPAAHSPLVAWRFSFAVPQLSLHNQCSTGRAWFQIVPSDIAVHVSGTDLVSRISKRRKSSASASFLITYTGTGREFVQVEAHQLLNQYISNAKRFDQSSTMLNASRRSQAIPSPTRTLKQQNASIRSLVRSPPGTPPNRLERLHSSTSSQRIKAIHAKGLQSDVSEEKQMIESGEKSNSPPCCYTH